MSTKPASPESGGATIEAALRYLGTRDHGVLVDLLEHAIDRPHSATGTTLAPLTEATAVLEGWAPAERAHVLWRVIQEGVRDPDVSPTSLSRRRRALQAAFRLPDADIHEPWGSSLTERFKQLKTLKAVFGEPTSTQPMETAWKKGVRGLATYLEDRFGELRTPGDWDPYRPKVRKQRDLQGSRLDERLAYFEDDCQALDYRPPSQGAQPVFVDLFVTTVFMKGRALRRRITERLVTAREDNVVYYTSLASPAADADVIVRPLWGCRAEPVLSPPGEPVLTRLWFPMPLQREQKHWFSSEVVDQNPTGARRWINVEVDHHGIAPGQRLYADHVPIRGLTIRIRFEEDCLPEACWWYAELTERERRVRPPDGDQRLLAVIGNGAEHTFTHVCQPGDNYGISLLWPAS